MSRPVRRSRKRPPRLPVSALLRAARRAGAGLGLLLGACAVGPDYAPPPVASAPSFAASGPFDTDAPLLDWWQVLGDDNLTALVRRATGGANLDLRSAQARIRQARAELGAAGAAGEPTVAASAQVSRDRYSRDSELYANLPFPNPLVQFTDWRAGFDASWEIDLFGHVSRGVEAAGARVQAAVAEARDVRISVAGEVARLYVQLREYEQQLQLADADRAALEDIPRLVQLRLEAGNASALELRQARADADAQAAVVAGLVADRAATLDALAVVVGVAPAEAGGLIEAGRPVPAVHAERIAVGLPSALLLRRPDVRRAERELAAATADIGVATADLYPRFELVGNFGVDTVQPGEFGQRASRTWSLAPQLYLPVLGRGRLTSAVSAREAARDAALSAYQKSVLTALSDVEAAMVRFDRGRERLATLQRAWQGLEERAALVREQHAAGRASSIEVLLAERQARLMREQLSDAGAQLAVELVALFKALGGGWSQNDVPAAGALQDGAQGLAARALTPRLAPGPARG